MFRYSHLFSNRILIAVTSVLMLVTGFLYFAQNQGSQEIDYSVILRTARYSNLEKNNHVSRLTSSFICSDKQIKLLIIVSSTISNFKRRKIIRITWGKDGFSYRNHDFRTLFAVGKSGNNHTMHELERESVIYKDIIQGNYSDNLFNLSYKMETILEWAYKYCKFDYLLKLNDDVFVNLSQLFHLLSKKELPKNKLYMGRIKSNMKVSREGKYAVSFEDYSADYYPPYCDGSAFIMSYDVVKEIIPYLWKQPIKTDDAYVAILIANLGIKPSEEKKFKGSQSSCTLDDSAITLRFIATREHSSPTCMLQLFYTMLAKNVEDTFIRFHYIPRVR